MTEPKRPRPVVLAVLDGWGHREECADNAVCQATLPVWTRLMTECPHALLDASAHEVGLPEGQMGNSEVGHMNLGAGRIVLQDLPRIDEAIKSGALARNPKLADFIAKLNASKGRAHLLGLLSPGGVHSHQDHLASLARLLGEAGVPVAVHGFLDGRDTPPRSALGFVAEFERAIAGLANVSLGTLGGRYYAMDRDKRWARVELAYDALVAGMGEHAADARAAIEAGYARGENDEFLKPTILDAYAGIADGDGILMANFRADRARQILASLLDPAFDGFARKRVVRFAAALGMVSYSEALDKFMPALFPPQDLSGTLGEIVARAGLKQLRIAETEKYAHVTFFFNGGEEKPYPGEERILVPSPQVATYDLKPEMSADEVTDKLVAAIASGKFDLIVVNYANGDMVGHTGILAAAIKAAETIDRCLGRLSEAVARAGGALLITADHGNLEEMRDPKSGQPQTAHSMNPVPLVLVNAPAWVAGLRSGRLADVAPTILALMNLPQPPLMTGRTLLVDRAGARSAQDGNRVSA
ncbi:MAG TPA: 2,3-bisphosphoglycerate-independent phosphoglycerate mutase [Alphaproteobacteria bacterium]|nr:2,3-bisphosphoglycerate-independent phosphoglycerate mutase [Alphaproteobacteria bacterium]